MPPRAGAVTGGSGPQRRDKGADIRILRFQQFAQRYGALGIAWRLVDDLAGMLHFLDRIGCAPWAAMAVAFAGVDVPPEAGEVDDLLARAF